MRQPLVRINQLNNEDFRSDRTVSKLVVVIAYETHYEAGKVDILYLSGFMVGNKSEVPERKSFGTIICAISEFANSVHCYLKAVDK